MIFVIIRIVAHSSNYLMRLFSKVKTRRSCETHPVLHETCLGAEPVSVCDGLVVVCSAKMIDFYSTNKVRQNRRPEMKNIISKQFFLLTSFFDEYKKM